MNGSRVRTPLEKIVHGRAAGQWNDDIGRNLRKRLKNESSLGKPRMRNRKVPVLDGSISIKQDIDVHGAVLPSSIRLSHAPKARLDFQDRLQERAFSIVQLNRT